MNVQTFDLFIKLYDRNIEYHNISRTAVNYYLNWYRENPEFYSYYIERL